MATLRLCTHPVNVINISHCVNIHVYIEHIFGGVVFFPGCSFRGEDAVHKKPTFLLVGCGGDAVEVISPSEQSLSLEVIHRTVHAHCVQLVCVTSSAGFFGLFSFRLNLFLSANQNKLRWLVYRTSLDTSECGVATGVAFLANCGLWTFPTSLSSLSDDR